MGGDLVKVYDLARDREYIERIQKATVEGDALALRSDNGLFGSTKWWDAVGDGTIPTHQLEGVISRIGRNAASDWPDFEMESKGERSTWALEGDLNMYRVGKRVRVDSVTLRYKDPPQDGGDDSASAVLAIWVEP